MYRRRPDAGKGSEPRALRFPSFFHSPFPRPALPFNLAHSLNSRVPSPFAMAPITEDAVSGLKDTIGKLEARVIELENRLVHGGSKPKSVTEQMRIILMGPPGAGI